MSTGHIINTGRWSQESALTGL